MSPQQDIRKAKPLEGMRVLDSTYVFALPYAGGLLADLGAEVIKVEGPGRPDVSRTGGFSGCFPDGELGEDWWNRASTYNLLHRGKRSLTLDLTKPEARKVFQELVGISDVVMENYTPRVMRNWGLDYTSLRSIKPDLIMVSNTGYGHGDGPYSDYPAQATTQEGTHGHCWVTGYVNGPPSKVGASYVDFLSTWSAVFAVAAALRYRNRTGKGQWVDLAMYQSGAMFISEYIMDYMVNGRVGERMGNRHPGRAPQGCYPALGEAQWVVLSVGSDDQWASLTTLMGRPDLLQDGRFSDLAGRQAHHDELDKIIAQWTASHDRYKLMEMLQGVGIAASPVFINRDTHIDPHFKARGFLEMATFPEERGIGARPFIGRPYRFSKSDVGIQGPAPAFGQDSSDIITQLLGTPAEVYDSLVEEGTTASAPTKGEPNVPGSFEDQIKMGRLAGRDDDYKAKLGIP